MDAKEIAQSLEVLKGDYETVLDAAESYKSYADAFAFDLQKFIKSNDKKWQESEEGVKYQALYDSLCEIAFDTEIPEPPEFE